MRTQYNHPDLRLMIGLFLLAFISLFIFYLGWQNVEFSMPMVDQTDIMNGRNINDLEQTLIVSPLWTT